MPRRDDTECHRNAGSDVLEGAADHGTSPSLRSPSYSTVFRAHRATCATARGEAEDNLPIIVL